MSPWASLGTVASTQAASAESHKVHVLDAQGAGLLDRSHNAATAGGGNNLGGSWYRTDLERDFVVGPRGEYYYPINEQPNSLARLRDAGSRSAVAAGLEDYTTQVEEIPDSGTVDIGFHYKSCGAAIWAEGQYRVTDLSRSIDIQLQASGGCADLLQYRLLTYPVRGALTPHPVLPSLRYEPAVAGLEDVFAFRASDGVQAAEASVYVTVLPGAVLSASGTCGSIGLEWSVPEWIQTEFVKEFVIYRSTAVGTVYPEGEVVATVPKDRLYYHDTTAAAGQTYYYVIAYRYDDPPESGGDGEHEAVSNIASASLRPTGGGGPMDLAFIVDNTSSMGTDLLQNLQANIDLILNCLESYSGTPGNPEYRLALLTPDEDQVNVRLCFADNNRSAFKEALMGVTPGSGSQGAESTDECLNTILNELPASPARQDERNCAPPGTVLQNINFTPGFRVGARKLVVIITDAPPDGFCNGDWNLDLAEGCAYQAASAGVRINAIEVDPQTFWPLGYAEALNDAMEDNYADISCGWHSQVPHHGGDIVRAVLKMIYEPNRCEPQ